MKLKREEFQYIIVFSIVILVVIFMTGLWLVDIAASANNLGAIVQTLWTDSGDPNFYYHLGLSVTTTSFLILLAILLWLAISFKYDFVQ